MTPGLAGSVASVVDGEPRIYTRLVDFAPCLMQYISRFITRFITAIKTRDTFQVMMNVQNMRTFAPTVRRRHVH